MSLAKAFAGACKFPSRTEWHARQVSSAASGAASIKARSAHLIASASSPVPQRGESSQIGQQQHSRPRHPARPLHPLAVHGPKWQRDPEQNQQPESQQTYQFALEKPYVARNQLQRVERRQEI